jgi:hypothetical protein
MTRINHARPDRDRFHVVHLQKADRFYIFTFELKHTLSIKMEGPLTEVRARARFTSAGMPPQEIESVIVNAERD